MPDLNEDTVMTMPNFLIIGPAKSATTSLYHYLGQHPEIYISPVKEPRFFAYEGERPAFAGPGDDFVAKSSIIDIDSYRALFDGVKGEVAIGEASPNYLYVPKAPERIRQHIPDAKLIAILRNPVERAYSNFMHNIRDGVEPIADFAQALREEPIRIRNNWAPRWHYRNQGFYSAQLIRYFERFERNQVKILLYDEFGANTRGIMRELFCFLGVDENFAPNVSTRYNMSGIPQNHMVNNILKQQQRLQRFSKRFIPEKLRRIALNIRNNNLVKPTLSAEIRAGLMDDYKEDIRQLEQLIERDLSGWMATKGRGSGSRVVQQSLWLNTMALIDPVELLLQTV
jgi:hypothetical protein